MNPYIIILIATILGVSLAGADAQLEIGGKALIKRTDVTISGPDQVSVVHEVKAGGLPRSLQLMDGNVTDITVADADGLSIEHGVSEGPAGTSISIFPTRRDALVSYGLEGVIKEIAGSTWSWDVLYLEKTTFHLPDSVDVAFINGVPIYFEDRPVFNCHGCQMNLEFVPDETKTPMQITWEEKEFEVEVWSSAELESLALDQPQRSIVYEFDGDEKWITLVIPRELLWGPYQATVNGEKALTGTFELDKERTGVSLKLDGQSSVRITGASVIPEFSVMILVMAIGMTAALVLRPGAFIGR